VAYFHVSPQHFTGRRNTTKCLSEYQVARTVFELVTSQMHIKDSSDQTEIGNTRNSVREAWSFVLLTPYIFVYNPTLFLDCVDHEGSFLSFLPPHSTL
jgi:hypothetical protein